MGLFSSHASVPRKHASICAQHEPYICVTNKHVLVYGIIAVRRIRGIELYRQEYTNSCMIKLKSNFSLSPAWPQSCKACFLFISLTVVVIVGSPIIVRIRGLSLERL